MRPPPPGTSLRRGPLGRHGDRPGLVGHKNGELLRIAAAHGFQVLITVDARLQVSPAAALSVLVLRAGSNRLQALLPLMPSVLEHLSDYSKEETDQIFCHPGSSEGRQASRVRSGHPESRICHPEERREAIRSFVSRLLPANSSAR